MCEWYFEAFVCIEEVSALQTLECSSWKIEEKKMRRVHNFVLCRESWKKWRYLFCCHQTGIYFLDGCSEFGSSDVGNSILLAMLPIHRSELSICPFSPHPHPWGAVITSSNAFHKWDYPLRADTKTHLPGGDVKCVTIWEIMEKVTLHQILLHGMKCNQ